MKLVIIIPAYNEEGVIKRVLVHLPKKITGIDSIKSVVVDDGSRDCTYEVSKQTADIVLQNVVNMGVGTATKLGLEYAKQIKADIVVTMDGDGQHNSSDISGLVQPILRNEADIVIGSRMFNNSKMPMIKRFGNWLMNLITYFVFGIWISDSQSGMKALSKKTLNSIKLDSIGYEICSEIIGEAKKRGLKITELPIETIYTDYSKNKGQNIFNAINILTNIISLKLGKRK